MRSPTLTTTISVLLASSLGCEGAMDWSWLEMGRNRSEPAMSVGAPLPEAAALARSAAVQDTVGAVAYVEGQRGMRVRGYGLVAGLHDKGSRECPESIRKMLISELEKEHGFGLASEGLAELTPEKLIDSPDTAVVQVEGIIPAAATDGERFDVTVVALAQSDAVALTGGRLYTCDLNLYQSVGGGPEQAGKRLATATGPIFVNPFTAEEGASAAATRVRQATGQILGGGLVQVARRLRLRLTVPSYELAYRITARINERFGHDPKVADALSPGVIQLNVPHAYRRREADFVGLILHLYIGPRTDVSADRARKLAEEILSPTAPHEAIALAWECLGGKVLPVVQSLYAHEQDHVRYHAAHTGLRLNDDLAVAVLATFARDADSPFHRDAIDDLGEKRHLYAATDALRPLLDHEDPRVRIAAYEALLNHALSGIRSFRLGEDNFILDVVESTGPGLIRAQSVGERRIAIFGEGLACLPPVFYVHPDRAVYINAKEGDKELTMIRRGRFAPVVSPPLPVSLGVVDLVRKLGDDPLPDATGEIRGLGMGYDQVMFILHRLCQDGSIPAKFMFDRPSITDLYGPIRQVEGRREADI